jgi:hypothetical protein
MGDSNNTEIVIAEYLESEWETWRTCTEDGEATFQGSYQLWREIADRMAEEKVREGYKVILVEIRVADFLAWAKRTNRGTDSSARAAYAGLMAEAQ